jgi:hypothetical protein
MISHEEACAKRKQVLAEQPNAPIDTVVQEVLTSGVELKLNPTADLVRIQGQIGKDRLDNQLR